MLDFETDENGRTLLNGKTLEEYLSELEDDNQDGDEKLQQIKEIPTTSPARKPAVISNLQASTEVINDLQKALEISIRELRGAVDAIASIQHNIEKQCHQSKLKAVESHQQAQALLSTHNMTGVFLNSVNKAAHIKVVQILREHVDPAQAKVRSLRKRLTNLEKLNTQFQNCATVLKSHAANPSVDPSVETLKQQLDLDTSEKIVGQVFKNTAVDAELESLKQQLDQL